MSLSSSEEKNKNGEDDVNEKNHMNDDETTKAKYIPPKLGSFLDKYYNDITFDIINRAYKKFLSQNQESDNLPSCSHQENESRENGESELHVPDDLQKNEQSVNSVPDDLLLNQESGNHVQNDLPEYTEEDEVDHATGTDSSSLRNSLFEDVILFGMKFIENELFGMIDEE
ncbi:hypothetical protein M0802_016135 [Mischocyttarus mexicanus]|nr:hypothetical protein M0802_016135 [Mischocyttarus mexicanus]